VGFVFYGVPIKKGIITTRQQAIGKIRYALKFPRHKIKSNEQFGYPATFQDAEIP
jgi:hypothetical protein